MNANPMQPLGTLQLSGGGAENLKAPFERSFRRKPMRSIYFRISVIAILIVAGLSIWDGTSGSVFAARKATSSSRTDRSQSNEILLAAASSFEDLTENALTGNQKGMQLALEAYNEQAEKVSKVLSPKARQDIELRVAAIQKAKQQADNEAVALNSVEAYRMLIESLDTGSLRVPVQVSLLDYAGFKLKVLLHAKSPDWSVLLKVAEEARRHWTAIESRVYDKGLRDAVNTMITGMNKATAAKNYEMAVFAAEVDLALVDLLEGYFEHIQNKSYDNKK